MLRGWWTVAMVLVALDLAAAGAACAQAQEKPDPPTTDAVQASIPASAPAQSAQASNGPKKLNPFTGDSAATAEGKKLWFKYNCYGCHGTEAGGGMGTNLTDAMWAFGGDDQSVFNTIKNGQGQMPPVGTMANIPDEEIWKLIAYIRSKYAGDPNAVVW
jgi:mono/diheme cytochrome c family protein